MILAEVKSTINTRRGSSSQARTFTRMQKKIFKKYRTDRGLFREINKFRANPKRLAGTLRRLKDYMKRHWGLHDNPAIDEAIKAIMQQGPL